LQTADLGIPLILQDQTEVFVDTEKIFSNKTDSLVNGHFELQPAFENPNETAAIITMKTDLNSNLCQWKHMGKSITDFIKTQNLD
jgi:hypothetical protein